MGDGAVIPDRGGSRRLLRVQGAAAFTAPTANGGAPITSFTVAAYANGASSPAQTATLLVTGTGTGAFSKAVTGLTPMARIVSAAAAGVHPDVMGIGPVPASEKALARSRSTAAAVGSPVAARPLA